jgi:hypothetical protein
VTPGAGHPPTRYSHALAYDRDRHRVVLFGGGGASGTFFQDTWEWDGLTWENKTQLPNSPPPRFGHALVYHSGRHRVMLYGGNNAVASLDDTWEWDGLVWSAATPTAEHPPALSRHAMANDDARGRVVLFGGMEEWDTSRRTWEWDGQAWFERFPVSLLPDSRFDHALAYDRARGRTLLFGGNATGEPRQDTWDYDAGTTAQPAFQLTVAVAAAGIATGDLTGLRVRVHCGGAFAPYGTGDTGAALLGWASGGPGLPPGSWHEVATNLVAASSSPPHLPAPPAALIDWNSSSADEARQYLFAGEGAISFQCRPAGVNGDGGARVALDYIEVRVRYRTP